MSAKNRSNNELAVEVCKFDIETFTGLNDLEQHVRATWTIREIDQFKGFLHGGNFISSADWSTGKQSGIKAPTAKADADLQRLWDKLIAFAWRNVGAASALHVEGAKPFKWEPSPRWAKHKKRAIVTGDIEPLGEDDKLMDMTICELNQRIGNAYAAMTATQRSLQNEIDAYKAKFGPLEV